MKKSLQNFIINYKISKGVFISYFISFALIFYFSFFTMFGNKGIFTLIALDSQIAKKDIIVQDLENKVKAKEAMVSGMKLDSLDLDLLDEQSRKILGYMGKDELVVYQNQ
jgi:cell division protein FtsB